MKKLFTLIALALFGVSAYAQETIKVGVITDRVGVSKPYSEPATEGLVFGAVGPWQRWYRSGSPRRAFLLVGVHDPAVDVARAVADERKLETYPIFPLEKQK